MLPFTFRRPWLSVYSLAGFVHHGEAVVMQPVDQRADRRIFLVFQQRRVVEGAQQLAAAHEFLPQKLVVDVEPKRLGRGIKVRPIDEQRKPFVLVEHRHSPRKYRSANRTSREWTRVDY
jgi:hypothetical protein